MLNKLLRRQKQAKKSSNPFLPRSVNSPRKNPKRKQEEIFSKVFGGNNGKMMLGVVGLILLVILGVVFFNTITSPTFAISEFSFLGSGKVDSKEIISQLQPFVGRNIFLTRSSAIEEHLEQSALFFEEVQVRKILPNKLKIDLNQREPDLSLINLSGVYLVDNEGIILDQVETDQLNFSPEDLEIIKGFGDPNAKYVEDRIRLDMGIVEIDEEFDPQEPLEEVVNPTPTPKPEDKFDFSEIKLSKKVKILRQIRAELMVKVDETLEAYSASVSKQDFAALPRVFVLENILYEKNDEISPLRLGVTLEASSYFNQHKRLIVRKIVWEGQYLITFELTDGKTLTFGTNRPTSEQLEDFELVSTQLKLEGRSFKQIDLSSKKVSVK
ncbi:MAG: cell division protein FtsQ/DivIB [Candidatus Dojkabacteria bacterium]